MRRKLVLLALAFSLVLGATPAPAMAASTSACSHSITTAKHWKSYPWKHKFHYTPINYNYHRVTEYVYYLDSYSYTNTFTCPT